MKYLFWGERGCEGRIWLKISDNDKIFSAKFEARHICDGCGGASLAWLGLSPNLQGDPDFDLLTNYPNSKFKYSNTKQLFTVLNPEGEEQRTPYKIFNFLKYKEILHLFHRLKYQFDNVTTENEFKAPNKLH